MSGIDHVWRAEQLARLRAIASGWSGEWLVVDETRAGRAEHCPAWASGDEWTGWRVPMATRAVGLRAAATGIDDPRRAVRETVGRLYREGDPDKARHNVADWLASLERGGRLAVADAALTWLVGWRALNGRCDPEQVQADGRVQASITSAVTVRARVDVRYRPPGGTEEIAAVSIGGHADPELDRAAAAATGAVHWLAGRNVGTVVVHHLASGQRARVAVTTELVSEAAERYAAALEVAVAARRDGVDPPAVAGDWCVRCERREVCPEGVAQLAGRPVVVGGIRLR